MLELLSSMGYAWSWMLLQQLYHLSQEGLELLLKL